MVLGFVALIGLIASFHTILYAQGRQVYSLSRAGYFPPALSVTHPNYKTPHVAMIAGALVGLGVMLMIWFAAAASARRSWRDIIGSSAAQHGGVRRDALLHRCRRCRFILLRRNQPQYRAAVS